MHKRCSDCQIGKPYDEFYKNAAKKDGYANICKACSKARRDAADPMRIREINRRACVKYRTGCDAETYEAMYKSQDGLCAICDTPFPSASEVRGSREVLVVDHCHETGLIRGLLCHNCNSGIGMLGDDPLRTQRAADYLKAALLAL